MNYKLKLVLLISIGYFFQSCSPEGNIQENTVVCTTNIVGDAVKQLLPKDIKVISLMGPGVDPHLYKAGHKDLELLQNARVIVSNGLHLEGKMAEVLDKVARHKTVLKMSDALGEAELILLEKNVHDPHIWFDVSLWNQSIVNVANELVGIYPEERKYIEEKRDSLHAVLSALHAEVRNSILEIPENQRVLVTAHDAFSYFGRAYSIEVKGLQGISTQSEYGLKDVTSLVDFLVERKIKAVFVETSVSEKSIKAVVEGCQQKGHDLQIGGKLYSDALGGKDEPGNNYTNMVNYNVNTITKALAPNVSH